MAPKQKARVPEVTSEAFDPLPYVRAPIVDVAGGVGLAVALINHAAPKAPPAVKAAAEQLREATIRLQEAWRKVPREAKADPRPADQALDTAWSALYFRLSGLALLPAAKHPRSARAAELKELLFPGDSRAFLQLDYASEWAESDKRLAQIDENELADHLADIAGPEFLAEIRASHRAFGDLLGITKPSSKPAPPPPLTEPLRNLARALSNYGLQLAAWGNADEKARPAVRRALAPFDHFRNASSKRGGEDGNDAPAPATPTTPVPNLPQ